MRGLMTDFQLSISAILRLDESLFGDKAVASRRPGRAIVRSPYRAVVDRTRRLAVALQQLGVGRRDPGGDARMGELELRGPWVAARYYNVDGLNARFTGGRSRD